MSLAIFLSAYLSLNCLVVVAVLGLSIAKIFVGARVPAREQLHFHYFLLFGIAALILLQPWLPNNQLVEPAAKVWSASSLRTFHQDFQVEKPTGYLSLATPSGNALWKTNAVAGILIFALLTTTLIGILLFARDMSFLFRLAKRSSLIRSIGRTRVGISDQLSVPLSFRLLGKAWVIIPSDLIHSRGSFHIALAHELQHHRQGDTFSVYPLWLLKCLCFWNPFVHYWVHLICEVQEFACDETLVDQKKVESRAYIRCLIEVAQSAFNLRQGAVGATGSKCLIEGKLLKRRVERMLTTPTNTESGWSIGAIKGVLSLIIVSALSVTALASKGVVQDRRVSMDQAQSMAAKAKRNTSFPIVINDLVLTQLNRYLGTPEGRAAMRDTLARMETHRPMVESAILRYGLPMELKAVPITESGYQNLKQGEGAGISAGMWQFIRRTAINFGLQVEDWRDDRLDTVASTDAALRYLQANNLRFKDWLLSLLAYNIGEGKVQTAIETVGSRDVWTLMRNGFPGDGHYVAKIMAAILIMHNPETLM